MNHQLGGPADADAVLHARRHHNHNHNHSRSHSHSHGHHGQDHGQDGHEHVVEVDDVVGAASSQALQQQQQQQQQQHQAQPQQAQPQQAQPQQAQPQLPPRQPSLWDLLMAAERERGRGAARAAGAAGPVAPLSAREAQMQLLRLGPFVQLLLMTLLMQHASGLLSLAVLLVCAFWVESSFERQKLLPAKDRDLVACVLCVAWGLSAGPAIMHVFAGSRLWTHLLLMPPPHDIGLLETVWRVVVMDLLLRCVMIAVDAAVLLVSTRIDVSARNGIAANRAAFHMYRTLVPAPIWFTYFRFGVDLPPFLQSSIGMAYVILKSRDIAETLIQTMTVLRLSFSCLPPFGRRVSREDLMEMGVEHCPICYSDFSDPIKLDCRHVYCESCIRDWIDQPKDTCPICRAPVRLNTLDMDADADGEDEEAAVAAVAADGVGGAGGAGGGGGGGGGGSVHGGSSTLPVGLNRPMICLF